jgi:excisionase family DNA binding protein
VSDEPLYLTVAEAAKDLGLTERTIRRWMSARLLAVYKRSDGRLVLDAAELGKVERRQRRRIGARERRRDEMLAQLRSMSYRSD